MPTYQYACTACGHQLEAVQSFADEPLTECPACEGRLRKLFSSVGVVFKGSGFYRTDSRADSAASAANGTAKDGPAKEAASKDGPGKDAPAKEATNAKDGTSGPAGSSGSNGSNGTAANGGNGGNGGRKTPESRKSEAPAPA